VQRLQERTVRVRVFVLFAQHTCSALGHVLSQRAAQRESAGVAGPHEGASLILQGLCQHGCSQCHGLGQRKSSRLADLEWGSLFDAHYADVNAVI
jgi:hypothetical protein